VRLVAEARAYDRREGRSRLGGRPLPERDEKAIGRVGSKLVRLPSQDRRYRGYEPRSTFGERRNPRAEQPYRRRFDDYERRREERGPTARDRLNIEAQRKVSRGPA
jgi:hypothetical protein